MKKLIILVLAILLIASVTALTIIKGNVVKETNDYMVREATFENKEAYHFEITNKEGVPAQTIIREAIELERTRK